MIDPLHALAFSVQANRGVYAVLLGSGVSRAARIPTGWEITLDLVRKLARVEGETTVADPESWYHARYQKGPDYSDLLAKLAATAAERQQLIRAYIEPSEDERADGLKAPTIAHRAIANLVAKGYIRVIVTTNFDRLMETALAEVGVVPTVLSSPGQVAGAMPLIHTDCCVIKVHGDYMDTRIRNTSAELERYPRQFETLLDRVFDEFGLIVCGWSAKYDRALRKAIERAKSRRFSHFWAAYGEHSDEAKRLIDHRRAQTLQITDADSFFSELGRLVESLEQFSRPHPLSKDAAVASLKTYLSDPKHRIRFDDLVNGEVGRVLNATSSATHDPQESEPNRDTFTERIRRYDAACETLIAMAATGGRWVEPWHYPIWQQAITKLAARRGRDAWEDWSNLRRYPATLLLYALGLGAIEAGDDGLPFLAKLFSAPIVEEGRNDQTVVESLPPRCLFERRSTADYRLSRFLEGKQSSHVPLNEWIRELLHPLFAGFNLSDLQLLNIINKLEILMGLSYDYHTKHHGDKFWAPLGLYRFSQDSCTYILDELRSSLERLGEQSPYVRARIFGQSVEECRSRLQSFSSWARSSTYHSW